MTREEEKPRVTGLMARGYNTRLHRREGRGPIVQWDIDGFDIVDLAEALVENAKAEERDRMQLTRARRMLPKLKPLTDEEIALHLADGGVSEEDVDKHRTPRKRPCRLALIRHISGRNKEAPEEDRVTLASISEEYGVSKSTAHIWTRDYNIDLKENWVIMNAPRVGD